MQKNFIATFFILIVSIAIFLITIFNLDPTGPQRHIALAAFLVSIFAGSTSFFTFAFFFGVELITGFTAGTRVFAVSLRRAILLSAFITTGFLLFFFNLFGIVEITLFGLFFALIEFFFLTNAKSA